MSIIFKNVTSNTNNGFGRVVFEWFAVAVSLVPALTKQNTPQHSQDFGVSGSSAPTTSQRATNSNVSRVAPQKRSAPASPGAQADEIPLGSSLPTGLSDVELENICRLQYARWASEQEYISSVGSPPDLWPDSGLYKVCACLLCTPISVGYPSSGAHV